jgi:hypothetical protein
MTAPRTRSRQPRPLDAGSLQPEISSFRLHLAAEGKAAKTITTYTQAAQWFAAGFLLPETGRTRWEEVGRQDVQQWIALLLGRYSAAYASNQYRALQQFFKWLAAEEDIGDPMPRMKPRTCPTSRSRSSPATNCPDWSAPAPTAASPSAATPRSSPVASRGHGDLGPCPQAHWPPAFLACAEKMQALSSPAARTVRPPIRASPSGTAGRSARASGLG